MNSFLLNYLIWLENNSLKMRQKMAEMTELEKAYEQIDSKSEDIKELEKKISDLEEEISNLIDKLSYINSITRGY